MGICLRPEPVCVHINNSFWNFCWFDDIFICPCCCCLMMSPNVHRGSRWKRMLLFKMLIFAGPSEVPPTAVSHHCQAIGDQEAHLRDVIIPMQITPRSNLRSNLQKNITRAQHHCERALPGLNEVQSRETWCGWSWAKNNVKITLCYLTSVSQASLSNMVLQTLI